MFESVLPSVCPSVYLSVRVHLLASQWFFAHACVHQYMRDISYFLLLSSYFYLFTSNFLFLTSNFHVVLGCLAPYEHVCVSLSVRAYVSECIMRACKHITVRVYACTRA